MHRYTNLLQNHFKLLYSELTVFFFFTKSKLTCTGDCIKRRKFEVPSLDRKSFN